MTKKSRNVALELAQPATTTVAPTRTEPPRPTLSYLTRLVERPKSPIESMKRRALEIRNAHRRKSAKMLPLVGEYRIIHGRLMLPRPVEAYTNPDGSEKPHEPKFVFGIEGDCVWLGEEDAARMLVDGVVEPADIPQDESRVGKCWTPPPVVKSAWARYMGDR